MSNHPNQRVHHDTHGHAATEYVALIGLAFAIGLTGFIMLGGGVRDAIVGTSPSRPPVLVVSSQAAAVEAAAKAGAVAHSAEALRFAELVDRVAYVRLHARPLFAEARQSAATMHVPDARAEEQESLAVTLSKNDFGDESRSVFAEARESASEIHVPNVRAARQQSLALALWNSGDVDQARAVFAEARESASEIYAPDDQTNRQQSLAQALRNVRFEPEARSVFEEARLSASNIYDPAVRSKFQKSIAQHIMDVLDVGPADAPKAPASVPKVEPQLRRLAADADWIPWLPSDATELHRWGAALAEHWQRFAEAPASVAGELASGAFQVLKDVLASDEQESFHEWIAKAFASKPPSKLAELWSHTQMPFEQAARSVRAMGLPEARMSTRGLLVRSRKTAASVTEELVALHADAVKPITVASKAVTDKKALQALFEGTDNENRLVHLQNIDGFDGDMARELAYLMDNHPEVFVIGEANDLSKVDPLLREKGRFGAWYQQ